MQMQGLLIMMFILLIVPIIMLFTNHNIFFIIMGIIILISSIRNIHSIIFKLDKESSQFGEDDLNDLEHLIGIDMNKLGIGAKVVKSSLFILFFIYCSFFVSTLAAKVFISALIIYRIHKIIVSILTPQNKSSVKNVRAKNILIILTNLSVIILITIVFCNKLLGQVL